MQIYKFSFNTYRHEPNIEKYILEVEEKPKTYMTTNTTWKTRINKSDIGRVDNYNNVYILEDNEKKAKELFCEKLRSDVQRQRGIIADAEKDIEKLEKFIKELS